MTTNTLAETIMTEKEIKKIAYLAHIQVSEAEVHGHVESLSRILSMIAHISAEDTTDIAPMFSPRDTVLTMREDIVTEVNRRDVLQKLAPQVESGLYLVPQVIE